MTGNDLIFLAGHLVANTALGDAEARYRSATSRAYYGAFHLAVDFLGEVASVHVPENHTGHETAFRALFGIGTKSAQDAARSLGALRTARNRADYRLGAAGFQSLSEAQSWVETAHKVRSFVESRRLEPLRSQVIAAIGPSSSTGAG